VLANGLTLVLRFSMIFEPWNFEKVQPVTAKGSLRFWFIGFAIKS
jgi:hypothetical protein